MSQHEALQGFVTKHKGADPQTATWIGNTIEQSKKSFDFSKVVKVGDKIPSFHLQNATGSEVSSDELLKKGALLMTFYRGEWCPFCNIAVQYLQRHLDEFKARGVSLVAITPEKPDTSLMMTEKHGLQFPVLTDLHNELARQLGIVYDQSWAKGFHDSHGIDLNARNGDSSWEVPVPATILVEQSGTVRNVFVEVDFRDRLDPKVALEWVDNLKSQ